MVAASRDRVDGVDASRESGAALSPRRRRCDAFDACGSRRSAQGLSFMLGMMRNWIYERDPVDALRFEQPLAELKKELNKLQVPISRRGNNQLQFK